MIEFDKISRAHKMVKSLLKGNDLKAAEWFNSPNILLGGLSPNQMIHAGRVEKLLLYIEGAVHESKRPR